MDQLSLVFLGTAGSAPTPRRGLPATLIRADGLRILVDCGEGTQQQLLRSVGLPDLDAIFITHYHLDHWLGLLGTLKSFDLRSRERPLRVLGPPGLRQLLRTVRPIIGRTGYPLEAQELDGDEVVRFGGFEIEAFRVDHRVLAYGYALFEDERPGAFDAGKAEALGIPHGPERARLHRGETVTFDGPDGRPVTVEPHEVVGESRLGRSVVFSGDTAPCEATREIAAEADVLVHEATFLDVDRQRAIETGHSTASQAAGVAADAGVRLLALTHLSTRYAPRELKTEARAVFPNTLVPRDFQVLDLPVHGAPALSDLPEPVRQEPLVPSGEQELL